MSITKPLLDWYDHSRRDLPWRAQRGELADAYRVWISEIMLQQTTVAAVKAYYLDFTKRWPTVEALAAAPLDSVLQRWAGLGYYARARNLHKCAKVIVEEHEGVFPRTVTDLIALPGIGPYTAAAIATIAFDERAAAVDSNVERVITRLHAIETPLPDSKPQIRAIADSLVPAARPGDFAQAMMDLGATVCAPRKTNCLICPLSGLCQARRLGLADTLPNKRRKAARTNRFGTAFWIERDDGAVLLRRRPEKGLLGGMMEIPSSEWSKGAPSEPKGQAPLQANWRHYDASVEHTFTHFQLKLDIIRTSLSNDTIAPDECKWVKPTDLRKQALPTIMKKVVAAVLGPDAVKLRH